MGSKLPSKGESNLDGVLLPARDKVVFSTKSISQESPSVKKANYLLKRAGEATSSSVPSGAEHIGSFAVHFYTEKSMQGEHIFHLGQQALTDYVPEGLADQGVKAIRKLLMEKYGRQVN